MLNINENLLKMEDENLFLNVTKKINNYKLKNKDCDIISLGIGDVSKPIVKPIIEEMHKAVDELADMSTFKGYGSYYGYDFLKQEILKNEYDGHNFSFDEIYISNGTKPDSTNILELFDINAKICITDPMYPIYRDGALALNRETTTLDINEENNFVPEIPKEKYDIIYMCSPSNPIGIAYTYSELEKWVKYALENKSVILFDNVYESFVTSKNVPKTIYEIEGAKEVAIEFRSFSKKASFTGVRCSYYIIPNEIRNNINYYWRKRTINRFNGADYIAQKGALAFYLPDSQKEIKKNIQYYMDNSHFLKNKLITLGFKVWGGGDSPFMWVKIKENLKSWELFELYLEKLNIVVIPGIIFGKQGDGYFRVSALGKRDDIEKAVERLECYYEEK